MHPVSWMLESKMPKLPQHSAHTYWQRIRKLFGIASWEIALLFSKFLQVSWMKFLGFFKVLEAVNNTAQGLREWAGWSNRLFPSLISVSLWFKDFLHLLAAASLGHFIHCLVILPILGNGRGYLKHHVAIETQEHPVGSNLSLSHISPHGKQKFKP